MISPSHSRGKLFVAVMLLLGLAQVLTGALSTASLDKLNFQSTVSTYEVIGNDLVANLTKALRFGKTLDKFIGLDRLLKAVAQKRSGLTDVFVADAKGQVLHGLDPKLVGTSLNGGPLDLGGAKYVLVREASRTLVRDGKVYCLLPIRDKSGAEMGLVGLVFRSDQGQAGGARWGIANPTAFVTSLALAMLVLGAGLYLFVPREREGRGVKLRFNLVVVAALMCGQAWYAYHNMESFRQSYQAIVRGNAQTMTALLREDIEPLLRKGIAVNRLAKLDETLTEVLKASPEMQQIALTDPQGQVLYHAHRDDLATPAQSGHDHAAGETTGEPRTPLHGPEGERQVVGYLTASISPEAIAGKTREILRDSLTVMLISFLLVFELIHLLFAVLDRRREAPEPAAPDPQGPRHGYVIRPVAFIFLLAVSLSQSFIPLRMQEIYQPMLGLSRGMILGLPISVEMLLAGASLIPIGVWIQRHGWYRPLLLGMGCATAGAVCSGLATRPEVFVAARGLAGFGYAMAWLATQNFVFSLSQPNSQARNISILVAGIFAGQICGVSLGGMLAERVGFDLVFMVSAALIAGLLVVSARLLRPYAAQARTQAPPAPAASGQGVGRFARFLGDRQVLAILLLSVMPLNVCIVGILMYMAPLYLSGQGVTQSDIGRLLMVFGLFSIYLAPWVSKFVDRAPSKVPFIVASGSVASLGLLSFYFLDGLPVVVFMVTMLGLSASLGVSAQTIFTMHSRAAAAIGSGQALSVQRSAEKIGQMLGPLLLGGMVAAHGMRAGLYGVGMAYLGATVVFALVALRLARPRPAAGPSQG